MDLYLKLNNLKDGDTGGYSKFMNNSMINVSIKGKEFSDINTKPRNNSSSKAPIQPGF